MNKNIVPQAEDVKFKVEIKDFEMSEDSFSVRLVYGYRRKSMEIPKSAMISDGEGNWYFTFNTGSIVGKVMAECVWDVPDSDYPDGFARRTDFQYLCFVAPTPCPNVMCIPCEDADHDVTYTLTSETDISGDFEYLLTANGEFILTANNEYILVNKQK